MTCRSTEIIAQTSATSAGDHHRSADVFPAGKQPYPNHGFSLAAQCRHGSPGMKAARKITAILGVLRFQEDHIALPSMAVSSVRRVCTRRSAKTINVSALKSEGGMQLPSISARYFLGIWQLVSHQAERAKPATSWSRYAGISGRGESV